MTNNSRALFRRFDFIDARHKNILLVEDNEGDVELLRASFELSGYPHSLFVVSNGEDAIIFLSSHTPLPDLVIMDIKMPTINGHETLEIIRNNPKTADIPIVMMTGSDTDADKIKARNVGANGYIVKRDFGHVNIEELISLIDLARISPSTFINVGAQQRA